MYGFANIKYKGSHPIVFGMTALGAGLGAADGVKKGDLLEAFIKMIIGGTVGLLFGYIIENIAENLGEKSRRNIDQSLRKPNKKVCILDTIKY